MIQRDATVQSLTLTPVERLRMRWKRRRLLWRSFRSRHALPSVIDRTGSVSSDAILLVCILRNERMRLPFFLQHYRDLGVDHFLMIDNDSDDGSREYLLDQQDVSLWHTTASYRAARFGLDWLTWLQMRYAHGHWCVMADVDELLVYGSDEKTNLRGLTSWLDRNNQPAFGALMLDLFPKGALDQQSYAAGQDPRDVLNWFDAAPFRATRQRPIGNLWVQGGTRERVFHTDVPRRSPTLNKLPLVKWNRRWAYVNSCHSILPVRLNFLYDGPGGDRVSGALLHTKFLPEIVAKSETEKERGQHFHAPQEFDGYYDQIIASPDLWHESATQYEGPSQLEKLGLIRSGDW